MSGIFNGIYKRRGDNGGLLQIVGRKMLAHLDSLRKLGGAESQVMRRRMPDGSIIEARFLKDQPVLTIVEGGGDDACAIYMESGCLDLGAKSRPEFGQPYTVSNSGEDKRIYFGEVTNCDDLGGLNGRLKIVNRRGSSECIQRDAGAGDSVVAKCLSGVTFSTENKNITITRAQKLDAQVNIPASCFTGLMRKYVQAMYGNPDAAYEKVSGRSQLRIHFRNGASLVAFSEMVLDNYMSDNRTTGLVDLGQCDYRFIELPGQGAGNFAKVYPVEFTLCGKTILSLLKSGAAGERGEATFEKLEAYLFTQMYPRGGHLIASIGIFGVTGRPLAGGWVFSSSAPRAMLVALTNTRSSLFSFDWSITSRTYEATLSESIINTDNISILTTVDTRSSYGDIIPATYGDVIPNSIGGLVKLFATGQIISVVEGAEEMRLLDYKCAYEMDAVPVFCTEDASGGLNVTLCDRKITANIEMDVNYDYFGCTHEPDGRGRIVYDMIAGKSGLAQCASAQLGAEAGHTDYRFMAVTTSLYQPGAWSRSHIETVDVIYHASSSELIGSRMVQLGSYAPGMTLSIPSVGAVSTKAIYPGPGCPPLRCHEAPIDPVQTPVGENAKLWGEVATVKHLTAQLSRYSSGRFMLIPASKDRSTGYVYRASRTVENFASRSDVLEEHNPIRYLVTPLNEEHDSIPNCLGMELGDVHWHINSRFVEGPHARSESSSVGDLELSVIGRGENAIRVVRAVEDSYYRESDPPNDGSIPSCATFAREIGIVPMETGGAVYDPPLDRYNHNILGPLSGSNRVTLPAFTSHGGYRIWFEDETWDSRPASPPLANACGLPAGIITPSFIGWA